MRSHFFFIILLFAVCSCGAPAGGSKPTSAADQDSLARAWNEAYAEALKLQTVAAWNRCIALCPTEGQRDSLIHRRRSLWMDYDSFQRAGLNVDSFLNANPCYIPILSKMDRIKNRHFTWDDLYNPTFDRSDYLAGRFIVGDFNTTDADGHCKGCKDLLPENAQLDEFRELFVASGVQPSSNESEQLEQWYRQLQSSDQRQWFATIQTWRNYQDKVEGYRTEPLVREPIIEVHGKKYCIGQRMCLCEIHNDTIIQRAQFVTSSKNGAASQHNQHDFDGQPRYYAPLCELTTRYWDRALNYDSLDAKRDKRMGHGSSHVITYKGATPLPNFMHMTPTDDYPGAKGFVNGIHEFAVGGSMPGLYMGSPMSLGCVRLHDYPSKFVRWWAPANTRFFIAYEWSRYKQRPS
ncbi:MAG: hypothetical protein ACKOZY_01055 [Flavobacteriales bacterium]